MSQWDIAENNAAIARRALAGNSDLFGASGAEFSPCGCYRYHLWREWGAGDRCAWVMLNPSTANSASDDPTIRRCVSFARGWGFGAIDVVNLFGIVSADPRVVAAHTDPVGPRNDAAIAEVSHIAGMVVVAWGAFSVAQRRAGAVLALLGRATARPVVCLGTTRSGAPRHPLYVAGRATLLQYDDKEATK